MVSLAAVHYFSLDTLYLKMNRYISAKLDAIGGYFVCNEEQDEMLKNDNVRDLFFVPQLDDVNLKAWEEQQLKQ